MTRKGTALNRLYPEALAEINAEDAKTLNLVDGDYVNIVFKTGEL